MPKPSLKYYLKQQRYSTYIAENIQKLINEEHNNTKRNALENLKNSIQTYDPSRQFQYDKNFLTPADIGHILSGMIKIHDLHEWFDFLKNLTVNPLERKLNTHQDFANLNTQINLYLSNGKSINHLNGILREIVNCNRRGLFIKIPNNNNILSVEFQLN